MRDEEWRRHPYRDSVGKLTIGVGHNLDDKPISDRAVRVILEDDVSDATRELFNALPWTRDLDEARQAVLINMSFNLGIGGLLQFKKTLAAIKEQRWLDAGREMMDSKWAMQVGPRAHRLRKQIETGEWQ